MCALKATISKLNPSAGTLSSNYSQINLEEILNTGLFNFEEAEKSAGWIEELSEDDLTPETKTYEISSFVYRNKKSFDLRRFWYYIQQNSPNNIMCASRLKQTLTHLK